MFNYKYLYIIDLSNKIFMYQGDEYEVITENWPARVPKAPIVPTTVVRKAASF